MSQLPSQALRRAHLPSSPRSTNQQQIRHASLMKRPHRPYTFTQLIALSDGSTYTQRTTSPAPVYKSTKDTRNHQMWQPSLHSLRNVEQDDAGRLRAFREKFGRGWDSETMVEKEEDGSGGVEGGGRRRLEKEESLMDLISGYTAAGEGPAFGGQRKGRK